MRINLNATGFAGRSSSFTIRQGPRRHPECLRCGTSLAGRMESVRHAGDLVIDVFRCPCGRGRHISRQAKAAG